MAQSDHSHAKRWLCLVALLAASVTLAVTFGSSVWDIVGATNTEPSSEDLLGATVVTTSSLSGDTPSSSAVAASNTAPHNTHSAVGLGSAISSQGEATVHERDRERTDAQTTASTGAAAASSSHEATPGASCTGTLPRADASIHWDSPTAGDVLTADVWCPTTPTQLPSSSRPFRWCTVVDQGLDHAQHMRVSMSVDADGGRVDVVYHNCSQVLASTKLSEYPKVDHRLRSEFGPGAFSLRVRGPEYHALRFAYTPSTCTYTARFEVSLRGQYCLDTTLVYANYDAVVEVGKRYPEPIQAFVFSDVRVSLEGPSPPANPPPCTTMSPGRWVRRAGTVGVDWIPPIDPADSNPDKQRLGCFGATGLPEDYIWQPRHCTYPAIARDSAKGVLRGLRVLFTGDSQMRNTWVTLAHLLGLKFPSSDHDHDVHSKTLGDGGFCAHDDEYDFHLCWRTNYALNRAVVLSKALATFHVVYFNPATHWRAAGRDLDPMNLYENYVHTQFQALRQAFRQLGSTGDARKQGLVMLAPYSHAAYPTPQFRAHYDHRTCLRLEAFAKIALAAWKQAEFRESEYLPFPLTVSAPFHDCTYDDSHYGFQVCWAPGPSVECSTPPVTESRVRTETVLPLQVVENVLRMLLVDIRRRFPDGVPASSELTPVEKFSTRMERYPDQSGRTVQHFCHRDAPPKAYVRKCLDADRKAATKAAKRRKKKKAKRRKLRHAHRRGVGR